VAKNLIRHKPRPYFHHVTGLAKAQARFATDFV
jgi:hypothetical protein